MKNILITGVPTGLGFCMAEIFLERGYRVFGNVRKLEEATVLQQKGGDRFVPLVFDVCDEAAIAQAADQLRSYLPDGGLDGLINNAGIAIGGPLLEQPMSEIRRHFEVNVLGLISVTRAFAPFLGAQKPYKHQPGRILNISSVSGKIAPPFLGAYVGTKFAVEGISHSLRRELLLYGIDVIVIGPGMINTGIWDKGKQTEGNYEQSNYRESLEHFQQHFINDGTKGMDPQELALQIADVFEKRSPKTRYAFVKSWFKNWFLAGLLPDRMLDRVLGKGMRLLK